MTVVGTESWTATSTTAFPTGWTNGKSDGTRSVAGGYGRLTPSAVGYKTVRSLWTGLGATSAKRQMSGTYRLSSAAEQYAKIAIRDTVGTTGDYPVGYYLQVNPSISTWTVLGGFGTGDYGTAAAVTLAAVVNHVYGYTILLDGFVLSARVWDITAGQTEPTGWQATWEDTDKAVASGVPSISQQSGNTTSPYLEFGPITVTDGVTSVTSNGTASSVGSASATTRLTAASTGTASGAGTASGTTRTTSTSAAAATGTGSAAAASALTVTATAAAAGEGTAAATTTATFTLSGTANGLGMATATTTAHLTTTATATGTGTASADGLLRATSTADAAATGAATAATTARLTATGSADGEGFAAASSRAPGTSAGTADASGAASAVTVLRGTSVATALSFASVAAVTVLTTSSTATAMADGSATGGSLLHAIVLAAGKGDGVATATTTLTPGPGAPGAHHIDATLTVAPRLWTLTLPHRGYALTVPNRPWRIDAD